MSNETKKNYTANEYGKSKFLNQYITPGIRIQRTRADTQNADHKTRNGVRGTHG